MQDTSKSAAGDVAEDGAAGDPALPKLMYLTWGAGITERGGTTGD